MLRISSPKDLLPFRPQEDLLLYEERLRKAVCESKNHPQNVPLRNGCFARSILLHPNDSSRPLATDHVLMADGRYRRYSCRAIDCLGGQ